MEIHPPPAAPAGMPLDLGNRTGAPMEIHPPPAAPAIVPLNSGGRAGHYQGKGVFSDGAQFSNDPTNNPGGIDFNAAHLDLQIKRDGNGIALPLAQQDLDNIYIEGLIPVILSIKPVQSSLEFLN